MLRDLGVPVFFAQGALETFGRLLTVIGTRKERLQKIWAYRIAVVEHVLRAGVSVLQCDIDALLLRNPFPELAKSKGDVVGQSGVMPPSVAKVWGYTVCLGFIYYRATEKTLGWFRLAHHYFAVAPDDQVAFNAALRHCGAVGWRLSSGKAVAKLPKQYVARTPAYGIASNQHQRDTHGLGLTLIPYSTAPRKAGLCVQGLRRRPPAPADGSTRGGGVADPDPVREAIVLHCDSSTGSAAQTMMKLSELGMVFVDRRKVRQLADRAKAGGGKSGGKSGAPGLDTAELLALGNGNHPSQWGA